MEDEEQLQYLEFRLDEESFAFDISLVREVLTFVRPTKVPQTPPYMPGVINLRGTVIPVVDLGRIFGLPETTQTVDTCIIIVEVDYMNESLVIGARADKVKAVFETKAEEIEPAPTIGTTINTGFLEGMVAREDGRFVMLLDAGLVFSLENLLKEEQVH